MKTRRLLCLLLALSLMLGLAAGAQAEGSLFFVAVNDTIPVTLNVQPVTSGGVTYVPYTAFDARPGNVVSAYNTQEQTFVLFTKDSRLVFDLATGEVTDENQNASTQTVLFRSGLLYLPLVFCASHFGLKVSMLESQDGYPVICAAADLVLQEPERLRRLMTGVYLEVAKRCGCTAASVERSLRTTVATAWEANPTLFQKMAMREITQPPTAGDFLCMVRHYLQQVCGELS